MIRRRSVIRRLTAVSICLMMAVLGVFASGMAQAAYADDEPYIYTVRVYSGKEGHFSDGSRVKTYTCSYGETLVLNTNDLGIELEDSNTYYLRGLKIAGHDNDEFSRLVINSYRYTVTGDESFSAAYGIAGGMVKYSVNYVDENGNKLLDSEEFYGMAGDKPVVSFRYIEGYAPNAYNLGKTLSENEADNVFTFTYTQGAAPGEGGDNGNVEGGNGGNGGNVQTGGGAANAAGGTGDGNGGPADYQDLDDNPTPLAPGAPGQDDGASETARQHTASRILIGAAIAAAVILIAAFVISRRRRKIGKV